LPHEATEPVLGKTYGVITYQEQVMLLCIVLGDFEPNEAAVALKVVAKGVARDVAGRAKLDAYADKFREGASKKGMSGDAITVLWGQILDMASYSFNRSHAAGYALQSYQDMWLKHYYPLEFFSALLSVKPDKAAAIIREARVFGIEILPPDINDSDVDFTIVDNAILFGLLGIKQVGDNSIKAIREQRPFVSFEDFEDRVEKKQCNAQVKRSLLGAGAFDRFGMREDGLMIPFHLAPSIGKEGKDGKVKETMWDIIFRDTDWTWGPISRGRAEVELMGHRIEADPALLRAQEEIKSRVWDISELEAAPKGTTVVVGGEVTAIKHTKTKKGGDMAFVDLSFGASDYSVTFFSNTLDWFGDMLTEGAAILVSGEWDPNFASVRADHVMTVEDLMHAEQEELAHAS
jgi:DNA polymerase-3 subunit alpha